MRKLTSLLICALLAVPTLAQTVDLNGSDWSLSFWVQPEEAVTDPAGIPAGFFHGSRRNGNCSAAAFID